MFQRGDGARLRARSSNVRALDVRALQRAWERAIAERARALERTLQRAVGARARSFSARACALQRARAMIARALELARERAVV